MDRPFSIQKLPFVALKHLINYLTPLEIYNFCRISKRIRNQIHSVIPKNKYKLKINCSLDIETVFECKGHSSYYPSPYELRTKYKNLHCETLEGFEIRSPTTEIGFNSMRTGVEMLCFVLKCQVDVLYIESKYCNWLIPSITDLLSSIQPSIRECEFLGDTIISPEVLYLIQNLKVHKKFDIRIYKLLPNSQLRFDVDTLYLNGNRWENCLTIDNIISSNCTIFQLGGVEFSSEEMNKFIKSWIQGPNSRMRYLDILPLCVHYPTVIEGIQVHEWDKSSMRFEHPGLVCKGSDFEGGTDIINVNGKRATFQIQREVIEGQEEDAELIDWPYGFFQFVVWDD